MHAWHHRVEDTADLEQAQHPIDEPRQVLGIGETAEHVGNDLEGSKLFAHDHPESDALSPLLRSGGTGVASKPSDLQDVSAFPGFDDLGRPGTFGTAGKATKIDYILCSPALFATITAAGVHRAGVWTASGKWPMYPTLKRKQDAASDHAAIWADLAL